MVVGVKASELEDISFHSVAEVNIKSSSRGTKCLISLNCLESNENWIESLSCEGIDLDRLPPDPALDIQAVCGLLPVDPKTLRCSWYETVEG